MSGPTLDPFIWSMLVAFGMINSVKAGLAPKSGQSKNRNLGKAAVNDVFERELFFTVMIG